MLRRYGFLLLAVGGLLVFSAPTFAAAGPPTIENQSASFRPPRPGEGPVAEVTAEVNPNGLETSAYLEYGLATETNYGHDEPYGTYTSPGVRTGEGNQEFAAGMEGLQPGDTYYYHVVAYNADGRVKGPPMSLIVPTPGTPGWEVRAQPYPTHMSPGHPALIEIEVYNMGADASRAGATLTDTLPAGLTAVSQGEWTCSGATPVTCSETLGAVGAGTQTQAGSYFQTTAEANTTGWLNVTVEAGASGTAVNHVTVSGGGAQSSASYSAPVTFSSTPAGFGLESVDGWFSNANGTPDTQAGSHPYEATFRLDFNTRNEPGAEEEGRVVPETVGGRVRSVETVLPPGFVGDPSAAPQCARWLFDREECPVSSQVGVDTVYSGASTYFTFPVYNLIPPQSEPAQFGVTLFGIQTFLDAQVRSGGDYGLTVHVDNIPEREINSTSLTLWGVPAEASHNAERCTEFKGLITCGLSSSAQSTPFLTLPTSCEGPLTTTFRVGAWESPSTGEASYVSHDQNGDPLGITGCAQLSFGPAISVAPDTSYADTPAGLTVEEHVPQEALLAPEGLSTTDIKDTKVVLPEGVVINPGQAAGLAACQESEDGLGRLPDGEEDDGPASCPAASKVGTDEISTPLLKGKLEGDVYVLQSSPPDLKLLITTAGEGVNLKLVGNVQLNEQTGQLTTTFDETPALPYTDFKLSFSGGAQAALDTPAQCGTYTTSTDFTPWATPSVADWLESSSFQISSGPDGGSCPSSPLPFAPQLIAGATTDQAGGFTDFSLLLQRGDGQQRIDGLQFKAPAGLTGELAKVPLCTNAQAEANECPAASQIGHTVLEAGPGPYPLVVPEPGQEPAPIYLTESYGGAPFGLSVVVPLHVGPFVLPTQRVRAKLEVNPITSALTVTTNPLPQVVAGIPTDLREIDTVIERPEFMVNPTNCNPQEFTGIAYGTPAPGQGGPSATASISSHFQVGACRSLEFDPKFTASTSARDSFNESGADLIAKVSTPNAPQGTQADIARFKVELPLALPSRLTTLQKACLAKVFEADPAACPSASNIGHAVVHTPLLPVPLEGPAIFVSHGGEAFPSLTVVLQGDGVTVDLIGTTFISHAGVTSTTFKAVPDDPFSTFELVLPKGKYSALAADGNVCKPVKTVVKKRKVTIKRHGKDVKVTRKVGVQVAAPLEMPTEIIGQNGAEVHEVTKLDVEGCGSPGHARKAVKQRG
jgi:hypothetical protein